MSAWQSSDSIDGQVRNGLGQDTDFVIERAYHQAEKGVHSVEIPWWIPTIPYIKPKLIDASPSFSFQNVLGLHDPALTVPAALRTTLQVSAHLRCRYEI